MTRKAERKKFLLAESGSTDEDSLSSDRWQSGSAFSYLSQSVNSGMKARANLGQVSFSVLSRSEFNYSLSYDISA